MIKKVLLIIAVGVVVGILVYFFFGAIPLPSMLQSAWTKAQALWATIPGSIKGLVTLGIPSLFAVFFAWTKTRAMTKLQETQLQASQQINQLEGEATVAQTLIDQQKEQITTMAGDGVTALTTKLGEAQTTIKQQEKQILELNASKLEAERFANAIMHPTEKDLINRLKQSGYTITKTVT